MKIIHLEKTFENVIANRGKDVFFLKVSKTSGKKPSYTFSSKRIETATLEDIQSYLDNPNVALVTVEME